MRIKYAILSILLLAATFVPAYLHGKLTYRWDPPDLNAAAGRLTSFPNEFGDWRKVEDSVLRRRVVKELQCADEYLNRTFENSKGKRVSVIVFVGPPGPTVRHPPEICYGNQSNEVTRPTSVTKLTTADGEEHKLKVLHYRAPGVAGGEFAICYGWTRGNKWDAPKTPRMAYGAETLLYKLQILGEDLATAESDENTDWRRFLEDFMPVLHEQLKGIEPDSE